MHLQLEGVKCWLTVIAAGPSALEGLRCGLPGLFFGLCVRGTGAGQRSHGRRGLSEGQEEGGQIKEKVGHDSGL